MKKILITAVQYPPCGEIGAKRPAKMADFLSNSGWDVTVLTVDPALTPPIRHADARSSVINIIRNKPFLPYVILKNIAQNNQANKSKEIPNMGEARIDGREFGYDIKRFLKYLVRGSLTSLDRIDEWSGWRKPAIKAIKRGGKKYDVVLSTIPPYSTAYLGMELAAYYKCKFVLDYRDPWGDMLQTMVASGECSEEKLKRHMAIEYECLNSSDLILTVSPAISEMLGNRVNKKILTIPQGFTGQIIENGYDKEAKYLLYAGNLAYGRDLSIVLSATKNYAETHGEVLKLIYCGTDSEVAYEQANSVGATEYLDARGTVGESEVLELAKRSLCNIVIVSPGYEYSYPGKVFDLITAGRPIYVISSIESEAGKLVEEYGIGHSIVGNSITDLAQRMNDEINRQFGISSRVNDLSVENIYARMMEEGLNAL